MKEEPTCPVCGCELEYDEVDIGVGVMKGNYYCPQCLWSPSDKSNEYLKKEFNK